MPITKEKDSSGLSPEEILHIKVLCVVGSLPLNAIAKMFNVSYNKVAKINIDPLAVDPKTLSDAVAAYRDKIVSRFINNVEKDVTLRQRIISAGLIRIRDKMLYDDTLTAKELSDIVAVVQKDYWTSIGQPTEISTTLSSISDDDIDKVLNNYKTAKSLTSEEVTKQFVNETVSASTTPIPATNLATGSDDEDPNLALID